MRIIFKKILMFFEVKFTFLVNIFSKDWVMKYIESKSAQMCKDGGWEQFVKDGSQALIRLLTKK